MDVWPTYETRLETESLATGRNHATQNYVRAGKEYNHSTPSKPDRGYPPHQPTQTITITIDDTAQGPSTTNSNHD